MATSFRQGSQEYEAESHLHISEQWTFSNRLDNQICTNFAGLAPSDFLEDQVPFPIFIINGSDEALPSFSLNLN